MTQRRARSARSEEIRAIERMERARLEDIAEQRRFALKLARTQAARDIGASMMQASSTNPLWSQAAIGVAGAVLATVGSALGRAAPSMKTSLQQTHLETLGEGMLGFVAAGAASDAFTKIADAFTRDSQANSVAFDLGSPGTAAADVAAMAAANRPFAAPLGQGRAIVPLPALDAADPLAIAQGQGQAIGQIRDLRAWEGEAVAHREGEPQRVPADEEREAEPAAGAETIPHAQDQRRYPIFPPLPVPTGGPPQGPRNPPPPRGGGGGGPAQPNPRQPMGPQRPQPIPSVTWNPPVGDVGPVPPNTVIRRDTPIPEPGPGSQNAPRVSNAARFSGAGAGAVGSALAAGGRKAIQGLASGASGAARVASGAASAVALPLASAQAYLAREFVPERIDV